MNIIKVAGRARRVNMNGETIEREDKIYVPSYRQWFETLDTYDHFVFRQKQGFGGTLLCSCGSNAGIFNFDAYQKFESTYKGQVIACVSLMQYSHHLDGTAS